MLSACSTLSIPVLKHETGETIGVNSKNVSLKAETSRAIPTVPVIDGVTFSSTQESNPTQSGLLGLYFKYGIIENLDLKIDTPFFLGGGGWRLSAKYQLLGAPASSSNAGNFAISAMVAYGNFASSGDVTYNTSSGDASTASVSTGEATYVQSLSATSIEFSFPISYKIFDGFVVYSGLHYSLLKADGTIHLIATEVSTSDLSFNLGIQNKFDTVLVNIEGMLLRAENPFNGESSFESYFGVSAGITF